jgi:hypothetical protein
VPFGIFIPEDRLKLYPEASCPVNVPELVHVCGAVQVLVELNMPAIVAELADCQVAFPEPSEVNTYPFEAPVGSVKDDTVTTPVTPTLFLKVDELVQVFGAVQVLVEYNRAELSAQAAVPAFTAQVDVPESTAYVEVPLFTA